MPISWNLIRIKADRAWETTRGADVKIAVLDTGVDRDHPALVENVKASYDFISGIGDGKDGCGHGTFVAGIIAANNRGEERVGVAPEANLHCLKVLGDNFEGHPSAVIAGIDWCIHNRVDIINMSFGLYYSHGFPLDHQGVREVLQRAVDSNILVVAAAGNEGNSTGLVTFPAAYEFVIAVAATDKFDLLAPTSSWGPEVNLCAPGDEIKSTMPCSHLFDWVKASMSEGNFAVAAAGTSFAAPHVTGVAALVLSDKRSITADELRRILHDSSENLGLQAPKQHACLIDAHAATRMDII